MSSMAMCMELDVHATCDWADRHSQIEVIRCGRRISSTFALYIDSPISSQVKLVKLLYMWLWQRMWRTNTFISALGFLKRKQCATKCQLNNQTYSSKLAQIVLVEMLFTSSVSVFTISHIYITFHPSKTITDQHICSGLHLGVYLYINPKHRKLNKMHKGVGNSLVRCVAFLLQTRSLAHEIRVESHLYTM